MNFRRNQMANALAQQMGPPQSSADLQFMLENEIGDYQNNQAGMNAALGQGGWASVGAALGGLFTRGKSEKQRNKISTMMREYFNAQNSEESRNIAAEEQKAAAAQERRMAALAKRYGQDGAEAIVFGGLNPSDLKQGGSKLQYKDGVVFNPETGEVNKTDFYRAPQTGGGQANRSALMEKIEIAKALGATPEQLQAMVLGQAGGQGGAKPLSAKDQVAAGNRAAASESLLGSIGAAEKMLQAGDVSTGPIAGRLTSWTGNAQKYNAELGGILSELRRLQKTPGSGADSDRELTLLLTQVPTMLTDEKAALDILTRLREKASVYASGGHPQIIPGSSASQRGDDGWGMEEIR